MKIQLSDHFTYKRLLRFVISPILMMLCTSLYSIVDGFFVSNFVGKTPFAAVNLVMPVCMALGTIGTMIGHRRKRRRFPDVGRGKTRTSQPVFFSARLFFCFFKYRFISRWYHFCPPDRNRAGSCGRTAGKLRDLQQNFVYRADALRSAKCFPELFCHCGKTVFEFKDIDWRGSY